MERPGMAETKPTITALADLYPADRWTKRCVHRMKNLHVQNGRGSKRTIAPEVLLINGPSYAGGGGLFGGTR